MPDDCWNRGLDGIYRQPDGTRGGWRGHFDKELGVVTRVQLFNTRDGAIRFDGSYSDAVVFVDTHGWHV